MTRRPKGSSADAGIDLVAASANIESEPNPIESKPTRVWARLRSTWARRSRSTKKVVVGIVAVAVLATAGLVYATTVTSAQSQFRLATVSKSTVTQSMTLSGTLTPISQASVSFPTSGKVASVSVKAGQNVHVGDELAQLDTKSLNAKVASANKSVAAAKLSLYQLQNGQSSTGSTSGGGTTNQTLTKSAVASPSGSSGGGSSSIAKLQKSITLTQKAIDQALAVVKIDLAASAAACGSGGSSAGPSASPSSGTSDCTAAQAKVMQDQTHISQLQLQQATQISQLNKALQNSSTTKPASSSANTTTAATAEQLAAAQKEVDSAEAALTEAQQNIRAATIVSPINGTVLTVPFIKGNTATATQAVVISGSRQYQASVSVAVDKIGSVKPGQVANVVPSGSAQTLAGSVATIGVAPTTSGSTVTYSVTINVPGDHSELRSGASATVEIITASVGDAISVPSSAIHSIGTLKTVNVFENGASNSKRVTTGAVGPTYTQITDGLTVGQQVILADLKQAVPSSNSTSLRGFGGGGGAGGFSGRPPGS